MLPVCLVDLLDWYLHTKFGLVFFLICPAHAWLVARDYKQGQDRYWYSYWWGGIVVFLVLGTVAVRAFYYEPFRVPEGSMTPSYGDGDYIIVKKIGYGTYAAFGLTFHNGDLDQSLDLERGRVYVFYRQGSNEPYLKRLIALPGDKLVIDNNDIFINDEKLQRQMIDKKDTYTVYRERVGTQEYKVKISATAAPVASIRTTLPGGQYYFLGDNRNYSKDSRHWGAVSSKQFIGEVVTTVKTGSSREF